MPQGIWTASNGVIPPQLDPRYTTGEFGTMTPSTLNPADYTPAQKQASDEYLRAFPPQMTGGGFSDWIKPIGIFAGLGGLGALAAGAGATMGGAATGLGAESTNALANLAASPANTIGAETAAGLAPGSSFGMPPGLSNVASSITSNKSGGGMPDTSALPSWLGPAAQFAGPILGSLIGAGTSSNAANIQAQSGQNAIDFQREMYNQNRADLAPYREAGTNALALMTPGLQPGGEFNRNFTMGDFTTDPGYAFRQSEAMRQWQNNWAAKGGGSGGPLDPNTGATKDLLNWSQGLASQEYQNAFNRYLTQTTNRYNRLAGVAGTGQTAANTLAGSATQLGQSTGDLMTGIGNARASGYVGGANALSNGLGQIGNNYMSNQLLQAYLGRNPGYAATNSIYNQIPDAGNQSIPMM